MENTTNELQLATLDDWDNLNLSNGNWNIPLVFNELVNHENHSELHSKGLYIHVQKNIQNRSVFDNNPNPKVVNLANTYMIKWGKFNDGILKRRKDDFANHYHYRVPNFPELPNVAVRFRPYDILPANANPRPIVDDEFRSGSSSTLLHLVSTKFDIAYEKELGNLVKDEFRPLGVFIPRERINIPIENIVDEQQFLDDILALFTNFENNRIL